MKSDTKITNYEEAKPPAQFLFLFALNLFLLKMHSGRIFAWREKKISVHTIKRALFSVCFPLSGLLLGAITASWVATAFFFFFFS